MVALGLKMLISSISTSLEEITLFSRGIQTREDMLESIEPTR